MVTAMLRLIEEGPKNALSESSSLTTSHDVGLSWKKCDIFAAYILCLTYKYAEGKSKRGH